VNSIDLKKVNVDLSEIYVITKYGNQEVISFLEKPKNLKLPKQEVKIKSLKTEGGYKITLKSDVFVKDVFLYTDVKGHFSDNFFNLEPNSKKTIIFETDSDEEPDFRYKTLNGLMKN
ncbi:glycoside hydrolase family 2 protein, partial [Nonlabens ulvanivorans]